MQRPVFVVGCPRSGTTLLYSMLVAAGGFAECARAMRVIYPRHFAAKHFLKTRTPLGRVLTKTRVWTEQPRAGEDPVSDATMGRR